MGTDFKYGRDKKAYLCFILDLYDNSIVASVISLRNDNPLVFETMRNALEQYPEAKPLIHSDRGFRNIVEVHELTQSMSLVGKCIDNGCIESFWGTLKVERYYLHKYDYYEELVDSIIDYYSLL